MYVKIIHFHFLQARAHLKQHMKDYVNKHFYSGYIFFISHLIKLIILNWALHFTSHYAIILPLHYLLNSLGAQYNCITTPLTQNKGT